jgi:hypothetical protein
MTIQTTSVQSTGGATRKKGQPESTTDGFFSLLKFLEGAESSSWRFS